MNYHAIWRRFESLTNPQVIWISALLGFFIGAVCVPTWIAGVESAEVVSGLVRLPVDNPTYSYHAGVYSFWSIQLPALLLKLGASAWTASIFCSGLECALAFGAATACTLVFLRNPTFALLQPLLFTLILFATEHRYPILWLPKVSHFMGQMGMFSALLTLSLLALGHWRAGLFLLGMAPSVHASLAIMTWVAAVPLLLAARRRLRPQWRRVLPAFLAGFGFFVVTFLAQRLLLPLPPNSFDPSLADDLTRAYNTIWDPHRPPLRWRNFRVDLCVFAYALYRVRFAGKDVAESERWFLTALAGMTVVAAGYCVIYKLAPDAFQTSPLNMLMINRWLNLNSIMLALLSLTMLARLALVARSPAATAGLLIMIALILLGPPSTLNMEDRSVLVSHWKGGHALSLLSDLFLYKRVYFELGLLLSVLLPFARRLEGSYPPRLVGAVTSVLAVAALGLFGSYAAKIRLANFQAPPLSGILKSIEKQADTQEPRDGVLIMGPNTGWYIQLMTRMGVLLDPGALTEVTYRPGMIVGAERILNRLYGTSIRAPEDRPRMEDGQNVVAMRARWQARTASQWEELRRDYNATTVLVAQDWKLSLPVLARADGFTLYGIPSL